MTSTVQAYYWGRNSIDDNGKALYGISACPELNTAGLKASFREGQRDMRGELRLSADTEWDEDEDAQSPNPGHAAPLDQTPARYRAQDGEQNV